MNHKLSTSKLTAHEKQGLAGMHPGYFAMVMATGILSIATSEAGMKIISTALFILNVVFFFSICLLTFCRLIKYPTAIRNDFADLRRAPAILTFVAALCVLGNEFVLRGNGAVAAWLFYLSLISWFLLCYGILLNLFFSKKDTQPGGVIDGGWLLFVVSTEAIAVFGTSLAQFDAANQSVYIALSILFFGQGLALYFWLMPVIIHRYLFLPFEPDEISPTHWIDMGAMAIATVAGAQAFKLAGAAPNLVSLHACTYGATWLAFTIASWWLPLMASMTIIKLWKSRSELRFQPAYWSAVFPIGMYAVALNKFSQVASYPQLSMFGEAVTILGISAWLLVLFSYFCHVRSKWLISFKNWPR